MWSAHGNRASHVEVVWSACAKHVQIVEGVWPKSQRETRTCSYVVHRILRTFSIGRECEVLCEFLGKFLKNFTMRRVASTRWGHDPSLEQGYIKGSHFSQTQLSTPVSELATRNSEPRGLEPSALGARIGLGRLEFRVIGRALYRTFV